MLGKPVADFSLPSTGGGTFKLSGTRGRKVVLYFYPRDNTPGCTQHCAIYGLSRDSLKSHQAFKAKIKFPFELLSDEAEAICQQFGVMKIKNRYGRKVRGIERSTFLLDEKGGLANEWRGVKVLGHVQEVLNFAKAL